jgi:alpha-2-macroglobulin
VGKQRTINKTYRGIQIMITFLVVSSLIAGCRLPWQGQQEAGTQEAEVFEAGQAPVATREPRPDLPPALVEVAPFPDSVIALHQPITLYFNQAMDRGSVEAALHFEPRISGRFDWSDAQTVTFSPDQDLAPGSRQKLTLDTSAQAANKQHLLRSVELNFQVAEPLGVVQTLPTDGALDVDPESIVFVAFNQPVVPMGETSGTEPGFTLNPDVPGKGEWLNTSTYVFTPEPSMNGGTEYAIQINPNLVATSGAPLQPQGQDPVSFTTTQPMVLQVLPLPGERLSLDGPIEFTFNMRMNTASVETHFRLLGPDERAVPGSFEWDENQKGVTFSPDQNLERDALYQIELGLDAESAGGLPIIEGVNTTRWTFPPFNVDTNTAPTFESFYAGYGQFQLEFTTPLDSRGLDEHIRLEPEVPGQRNYASEGSPRLWINGYFSPETTYTLTVDADLQDIWGDRLGESFTTTFLTPPAPPSLSILSGYVSYDLVFIPASQSEIVLQATNISTVSFEISPISASDLMTLLHPDNYNYRQMFLPETREVTTHTLNLAGNRNEVVTLPLSYQGESLNPGIYYLGIQAPDITENDYQRNQKFYLVVSENNLVMKIAPDQAFVWVTRLNDLTPLVEASVSIYNTEGDLLTKGRTDTDGLFSDSFTRADEPYSSYYALVGEPGEKDFAFSISTWQDGYFLYEQGIRQNTLPALFDAHIYTDRPIYRPGDTIHFKTVLFSRDNGLPMMPDVDAVAISVQGDPGMSGRPTTFYEETLTLSQFGTVSGSVQLPDDAPTGYYWIDVSIGEEIVKALYFDVAAYRKPEIDLTVGFEQAELLAGEDVTAEAQADYFFGLPAADQTFSWTLYRKDADFQLPGYRVGPLDDFWIQPFIPEYSPLGTSVAYGEGKTDDDGHLSLSVSADELGLEEAQKGRLGSYNLEVTVMDQSGFPVSFRDSLLMHPETFYIGVQPEAYFGNAGSLFNFSILTVDWAKEPIGQIPIEATFESINWNMEETGNPESPYRYQAETTLIGSSSPRTDRDGQARVSFTPPEPGTYQLTVESGDAVTEVLIWVSGGGAAIWPTQMKSWIDMTADSDNYQPGQIAQVFIPNPFVGSAKALVTVERGRIMSNQVLEISGSGEIISIPITAESIPNIYVSAVLVGRDTNNRPDYRYGMLNLPVPPLSKALNIQLDLKPALTEPGEMVTLNMKITDQGGRPIQGEFSIAVVDKALLALVPPNIEPILEALYGEVPLSVQTSLSLYTYAKQQAIQALEVGGQGGGADRMVEAGIREEFPDTAFWQANVITGADGTARLTIPLPDSLTTWVVEARGLTEDHLVGQAQAEVQTQKPLMIRPVTPRFLVDGDRVELAAVVHNNTGNELDVDVSLSAVGLSLDDVTPTQRVTIQSGQSQRVTWWGLVESIEAVDLVFRAVAGTLTDASAPIWGDLQVKRYTMPYTFSSVGQLAEAGARLELVSLPLSTDPSSGVLSLVLNPSLFVTLVDGLEALETIPYNDTVTILSRLLANLNAYLVLEALGEVSPQLASDLRNMIGEGINQLLAAQNFDGGWSWWGSSTYGESTSVPFITAYVLLGLEAADESGLEVGETFLARARDYLVFNMGQPEDMEAAWQLDRLVFQTYALRKHRFDLTSTLDGLYARRSELSPWAVGLLALTLREQGGVNARVNTMIGDLEARAIRSATGVHWESDRPSWILPGTPVFNTAAVVYALAQLDPASISLPLALQYLMAHQDSQRLWSSSFESAWVLMAVAKSMQGTGDYQADYAFQSRLNDVLIAEGVAAGPESLNAVTATTPIENLYPDSPNALLIERGEGAGTLYYRVDLHTYQPAATAPAIHRGISLDRAYYLAGEGCPAADGCTPIGEITLDPDDPSQFITVTLTVVLANDMYNLMVEDFIPAGTEVLNRGLLTSPSLPETSPQQFDPSDPFARGWGWWYFNPAQIYDDHILWTADYVPAGTYMLMYELLPYQRGTYQVLPAHAWQFYYPEVQGTSAGDLFSIE